MKYYYGNSYKEAVSNSPIEITSTNVLRQYEEVYNVVIPVDDFEDDEYDEDDEYISTVYIVTFDENNQNLYSEFTSREEAFEYAKKYVENLPCVIKCWQPETDVELGFGEHYKETDITDEDEQLMEMIENNL